jgi:hypothetical protein
MAPSPAPEDPNDDPPAPATPRGNPPESLNRREFLAGSAGLAATGAHAAGPGTAPRPRGTHAGDGTQPPDDGTPEQIHLTWGADPAASVVVSWASPGLAVKPRVDVGAGAAGSPRRSVPAAERTYVDGLTGQPVYTYHARLEGLHADTVYHYRVTADNDARHAHPFAAEFRTAPRGRAAFRFTSYGDLATPNTRWLLSSPQAKHAVTAVERFAPLFHLMNGDLCYANLNPTAAPAVWADFGNNVQTSAAHRPWMPCTGNHEVEFLNGPQGLDAYLTRFALPDNGTAFPGCWYRFRVGSAVFISLCADDVIYQDSTCFVSGPAPLVPAAGTGHAPLEPGASLRLRGFSGGEQTRWLEKTLAEAAADPGVDWIIVQMHQDSLSSSKFGNGCDKGIREAWLPLFDRYGVDLVLCGHDHDYERSWPVRGCDHDGRDAVTGAVVDTCRPLPAITTPPLNGKFDARLGTIHLILGGGGTSSPLDAYGTREPDGTPQAKVFTRENRVVPGATPGTFMRTGADALEDAIWSARRDTVTGYGIAVFDLDPGEPGGQTFITMSYYHAVGADRTPTPDYEPFETIVVAKPRRG